MHDLLREASLIFWIPIVAIRACLIRITKQSRNIFRVGVFLILPAHLHVLRAPAARGTRADGWAESNRPPIRLELNGSGRVRDVLRVEQHDVNAAHTLRHQDRQEHGPRPFLTEILRVRR